MATSKDAREQKIEDYLALPYTIRVTPEPSGGYVADVEELPGCITQAETREELREMVQDAMRGWIALKLEDGQPIPEPNETAEVRGTR